MLWIAPVHAGHRTPTRGAAGGRADKTGLSQRTIDQWAAPSAARDKRAKHRCCAQDDHTPQPRGRVRAGAGASDSESGSDSEAYQLDTGTHARTHARARARTHARTH